MYECPARRGVDCRHLLVDYPEQLVPALPSLCGTGEPRWQLFEPCRNAIHKGSDVRLHSGGRYLVGLGEDEDERHGVAHEPFHEREIDFLRRQTGLDERKDQAEVCAMLQINDSGFVESGAVLLGTRGKAISRQIHQPPTFIHREEVNELSEPRGRRDAGQSLLAREHVQQRGLADVRAPDEGELRQ